MSGKSVASPPSISTRIVTASVLALVVALLMIGGTLWLSWQLEGGAAAINDAGSLRMRTYRLALDLRSTPPELTRAREDIAALDDTLEELGRGDPARPLVLPGETRVRTQYEAVREAWRQWMKPLALASLDGEAPTAERVQETADRFVARINELVSLIEHDNASKTAWLRTSQGVLIAIAITGTVAMIYLVYLWIIVPVQSLQRGVSELARQRFDVRIAVDSDDELGQLARGFNAMAEELQQGYRELEQRVRDKTAQLASQNLELAALYEMAAYLSLPAQVEAQCQGFLQRVMARFGADGASLRSLNPENRQLHLVIAEGVPQELLDSERCQHAHACLCGLAAAEGVTVLRDLRQQPAHQILECRIAGFASLASFRIGSPQATLGSFTLHFRQAREITPAEMQLLETLGQQLGIALENARLAAHERQLAVLEERNLVAQGLHDSLAQSLNYLNMQIQLLERALGAGKLDGAQRILPRLQAGLRESYNDVRELLANFRTRVGDEEIATAIGSTLERFRAQTGLAARLDSQGKGAPLTGEQKLQILFIVQEALSNVRKHARAHEVKLSLRNEEDFELVVSDDGCGFDRDAIMRGSDDASTHVGLHIMLERAQRMHAKLDIQSRPGQGTRLSLNLPQAARTLA